MSLVLRTESCRKVLMRARESFEKRMESSIAAMLRYSKLSEADSLDELGFGNTLLLSLVYALSTCDMLLSEALLELSASYKPLKSSYYTLWLLEDYLIETQFLKRALEQLNRINRTRLHFVPEHIQKLFIDLAQKSGINVDWVHDDETSTGAEGNSEASSNTNVEISRNTEQPAETDQNAMLLNAVISDRSAALEELAARGADLSVTFDGQSLLHLAAREGCINTAKSLIQLGARLNRRDRQRLTPLHKAVEADSPLMVQLLIGAGADASCKLLGGESLLMFAIANNSLSVASVLLGHRMRVNDKNNSEDTVLHTVLKEFKITEQSLDLEEKKSSSSRICNIIKYIAYHNGNMNITNAAGETALHIAAGVADKAIVKSLLESGAAVDVKNNAGDTPLHIAASSNNYNILGKLVCSSSNINIKNQLGKSPLHLAVTYGCVDCIEILLESNANLDTEDDSGYTPLCTASEVGNMNIVEILSKAHVRINYTITGSNMTPLHLAAQKGHVGIVKVLLESGADVQARATGCPTASVRTDLNPLHYAAMEGHLTVAQLLLERNAELQAAKDGYGCTPLHWAAWGGHLSLVQHLIECGADLKVEDSGKRTPLDCAVRFGRDEVASHLRSIMS